MKACVDVGRRTNERKKKAKKASSVVAYTRMMVDALAVLCGYAAAGGGAQGDFAATEANQSRYALRIAALMTKKRTEENRVFGERRKRLEFFFFLKSRGASDFSCQDQ
jgi:hypothetical protein